MNRLGKLAEVRLRGVNTVPSRSSHKQSSVQSSSHVSWVSQVTWRMWVGLSVFTLLTLMVSISAQAAEETWKPLGSTADGQVYVDTMTATTDDKGITHAQVRLDYVSPTEIGTLLLVGQQSQVRLIARKSKAPRIVYRSPSKMASASLWPATNRRLLSKSPPAQPMHC